MKRNRVIGIENMTPVEFRSIVGRGEWVEPCLGACPGYARANLTILPKEYAFDFLLFCHRNPKACPILDVTEVGSPNPPLLAPGADLRADLARYRVYKDGQLTDEPTDINDYWRADLVGFLIGFGGIFDWALKASNIRFQVIGAYTTNIPCIPAGPFNGNMVVTCRIFESSYDAIRAIQISSRYPSAHGTPIYIGDPAAIGINDLRRPNRVIFPDVRTIKAGSIAMFWGCGATLQDVAIATKLPLMITHYPLCMFMTDKLTEEFAVI